MADGSKIEWTDATWNVVTGCDVVSPGCTNCYAMRWAGTRLRNHPSRVGLTQESKAGPVWTGAVRFNVQWLDQPLKWSRPRMIFVAAHGDLFHEGVEDAWLDRIFAVMALCPQHTFQVLTKRPARARKYLCDMGTWKRVYDIVCNRASNETLGVLLEYGHRTPPEDMRGRRVKLGVWPLQNVWLGTSVEDQKRADERIPQLLQTPAAVRWISAEPLLGPLDLISTLGGTLWIGGGSAGVAVSTVASGRPIARGTCTIITMNAAGPASTGSLPAARAGRARGQWLRTGCAACATSAWRRACLFTSSSGGRSCWTCR